MLQATAKGSYHNLAALVSGLPEPGPAAAGATGLASGGALRGKSSLDKTSSDAKPTRCVLQRMLRRAISCMVGPAGCSDHIGAVRQRATRQADHCVQPIASASQAWCVWRMGV